MGAGHLWTTPSYAIWEILHIHCCWLVFKILVHCFQNSCTLCQLQTLMHSLLLYFILYVHLEYVAPTYKIEDRNLLPKPQKKLVKSYRSIHQNFTPSYAYNCLKACARSHHVLATKLTSYMNDQRNNWGGGWSPSCQSILNECISELNMHWCIHWEYFLPKYSQWMHQWTQHLDILHIKVCMDIDQDSHCPVFR